MKILSSTSYSEDMTVSASMSGITILKEGKFRKRHGGSKEIIESFPNQLLTKAEYKKLYHGKAPEPKKKKKVEIIENAIPKQKRPTPNYKVNKKEVTHRIRNFVNQMTGEKQLYFWTITFPVNTSDDTAFICFNKWLTRVRKELKLRSYIWVSERQENKTIHFHIAIHQRMCVKKANRFMRACLFTSIDNGEIKYSRDAAMKYNGVDIAKNRKTGRVTNFAKEKSAKNLTSYLTKYITKNDSTFTHLAWHSSRDYSNLIIAIHMSLSEFLKDKEVIGVSVEALFDTQWFQFYKYTGSPPKQLLNYLAFVNQIIVSKFISN